MQAGLTARPQKYYVGKFPPNDLMNVRQNSNTLASGSRRQGEETMTTLTALFLWRQGSRCFDWMFQATECASRDISLSLSA
jgi:hypothetical protein